MARRFWLETLGCPKNDVDSDKLLGLLRREGAAPAAAPDEADLVVVNTCAFVEEARQESIDTILELADRRPEGARLVVTGCLAERYGDTLREEMPEIDEVARFGAAFDGIRSAGDTDLDPAPVPVSIGSRPPAVPDFDLLRLPRPAAERPWAYVKIAEGCDRNCGFCAIPSFRGPQRSRTVDDVLGEVEQLGAAEIVLVAQDLASFGRDQGRGERRLVDLLAAVSARVERVRCLYLYPSDLTDELVDAVLATGVPYFDLSLQHVSRPHLRRMRRWGSGEVFLERIERIRRLEPGAALRSNFIVGYPGETEDDQDALLDFVESARLDWCGFFPFSAEEGTYAADLPDRVEPGLVVERLNELRAIQDRVTAERRSELVGATVEVLVDEPGVGRTFREAPEIDGVVHVPPDLAPGNVCSLRVVSAVGPDLEAA